MNYEEIIKKFPNGKKRGNSYQCKCPKHNDKKASLTITKSNDGKSLIYCHAGCEIDEVLDRVGLKVEDLYEEKKSNKCKDYIEKFTEKTLYEYLLGLEINGVGKVTDIYKYTDENGKFLYYKVKTYPKGYIFVRCVDEKLIWKLGADTYYETYEGSNQYSTNKKNTKCIKVGETEKVLYNLPAIKYAKREGYPIFIVEGEKDVETMKKIGLLAISTPIGAGKGEKKWKKEYSELLKGCDVVILPDNDDAGLEFAELIKDSLLNYCYKVRQYVISDKKKGDVSDWYEELGEDKKKCARKIILENIKLLEPDVPKWFIKTKKNGKDGEIKGYDLKLRKNYFANHLRTNLNFVMIGDIATSKPNIYVYYKGVYEMRADLASEIAQYFPVDNIYSKLLSEIEMLIFKGARLDVKNSGYLDGDENVINFKNGLYNVQEKILHKHNPNYKTSIQLQVNYNPNAKNHKYWDRYIEDLSEGKEDNKVILQEMAGIVISNIAGHRIKKFLGLYGKGNTGKGKFWQVLHGIIGDKGVGIMSIEQLCDPNGKFNTVALLGKTFVYTGDASSITIKDPTQLKMITGGDSLIGQYKFKDIFDFRFNGIIATTTNELPIIEGDFAEHMFKRVQILPCNNVIPEERQDKYLVENILKYDSEYIVNWALEGLGRLIKNNYEFSYCEDIERTRKKYKIISDSVFAFLDQMYEITGDIKNDRVPLSELRRNYLNYCKSEGIEKAVENKRQFIMRCENNKMLKFGKVSCECIKGLRAKK